MSHEINSKNPQLIELSSLFVEEEIENFRFMINILLDKKQSVLHISELLCQHFLRNHQFQKCLDFFLDIQNKIELLLDTTDIIQLMNYILVKNLIGQIYNEMQLANKAKIIYHQVLDILEKSSFFLEKDQFQLLSAATNQNLGVANKLMGAYDESEKHYLISLDTYKKYNIIERQAEINQNLGNIKRLQEKYNEAKKYINESLILFTKLGDEKKMAENHHNLALVEMHVKNYDEAENLFYQVIEIYEKFNDKISKAEIFQDLGNNYLMQGKFTQARKYFNLALELFIKDDFQTGRIFLCLGIIEFKIENYEKANLYYIRGLEIALKYKDFKQIAKLLNNLYKLKTNENGDVFVKKAWDMIEQKFNGEEVKKIVYSVEQLKKSNIDILDFQ